jgi:2'-5' RNA ligase
VETALVLVLDDSEPFDAVRRQYASWSIERGIPFHITLLFPFAPRSELSDGILATTRAFFVARRPLEFELTRVAMWPEDVYAVPEPDDELRDCMYALHALFPQWPPYGGIHDNVVPHATLGEDLDASAAYPDIERRVGPQLPRHFRADAATLLEEYAPDRWRERERLPFGATR